jgi:hypothetical protein
LGPRKKEPRCALFYLSKVPVNEPPPGSPTGPLETEQPVYKAFFYISLKFLIKISLNKEFFPSLKGLGKKRPSMFPRSGAPMEIEAHF